MSLVLLNIFFYLISFILFISILFIVKTKTLVYLDRLNQFSKCTKLRTILLMSIFNISGTPPTPLFLVKACNMYYVYSNLYSLVFFFLLMINILAIVFYVQFFRFIYRTKSKLKVNSHNYLPILNKKLISLIVILYIIILFLFISPDDILMYFSLCLVH